jgi:hypothetical protein
VGFVTTQLCHGSPSRSQPAEKKPLVAALAASLTQIAEKKTPPAKVAAPLPEGMLGTKEAAELCKVTPRLLRVVLRSLGKGTGGERYQWKKDDPFLKKLPALIAEHKSKAEPTKKTADKIA